MHALITHMHIDYYRMWAYIESLEDIIVTIANIILMKLSIKSYAMSKCLAGMFLGFYFRM